MTIAPPQPVRPQLNIGRAFLPLFTTCRDSFVLIESPRGCLKTCTILHALMSRAAKYPGLRWYLWRSTKTLLTDSVMGSFERYVIPFWSDVRGMRLMNPGARPKSRAEYVFENGSVFLPVPMDEISRGTSAEGAGGYVAEAGELAERDQVTALVGMMRQPGIPYHQIIVDTNPSWPSHWLNKSAEAIAPELRRVTTREEYERLQRHNAAPAANPMRQWKRIVAKIQDNPFYFDVEAWKLTRAGDEYIRSLGILSGHLHARWVEGEWRAAEGGVFPEFSEARHVIKPFDVQDWPVYVAYDPGYDHPCAVVFLAVAPNGQLFVCDSIYGSGINLPELQAKIREKSARYNMIRWYDDPHGANQATQAANGKTIRQQMHDAGFPFEPWPSAKGPGKQSQVEAVRKLLIAVKPLQVFSSCVEVIEEFQSWSYKRTADGSTPAGDDAYEDRNNHAMDALSGLIATNPVHAITGMHSLGQQSGSQTVIINGRRRVYEDDD